MIGIIGQEKLAVQLKGEIKIFLENTLKLQLSDEKTKITSLTRGKARFLGVDIFIPKAKESKLVYRNMHGAEQSYTYPYKSSTRKL